MSEIFIPPGFAQITLKLKNATGHACVNLVGVRLSGPPTQVNLNSFSTTVGAPYTNVLSTSGRYDGLRILIGQDGGPPTVMESTSGSGAGGRGGAMSPPQVQHLIKKGTAFATREGVGRLFIPDVLESEVDQAGVLTALEIALVGTLATAIGTACTASVFTGQYLLHSTGRAPDPVTSFTAQPKAATLRRRYDR